MSKSLFKSIILIVSLTVFFLAILINFDFVISGVTAIYNVFSPIIIGFGIAFILNRPTNFFKKQYKKLLGSLSKNRMKKIGKICSVLSIITAYLVFFAIIALVINLVIPQLFESVTMLYDNIDVYISNIQNIFTQIENFLHLEISIATQIEEALIELVRKIPEVLADFIPSFFSIAGSIASSVAKWILGIAISVYMLSGKEMLIMQVKRFVEAFIPEKIGKKIKKVSRLSAEVFSNFFSGQMTDAVVVGLLCFIGMTIFRFEYAFLISTLIAITNIIPIAGPFIGAIPSAFLLLIVNPLHAVWFSVFILILQQIDGNFICPRIVGDSVGLPSWWVLFAIFVGGGVFGVVGMIVGVPAFCIVYRLLSEKISKVNIDK